VTAITADALGEAILPLLAEQGWDTAQRSSGDGLTRLYITAMCRDAGQPYVELLVTRREQHHSFWVKHNVVSGEVWSLEQAVGYLRLAGVLPGGDPS